MENLASNLRSDEERIFSDLGGASDVLRGFVELLRNADPDVVNINKRLYFSLYRCFLFIEENASKVDEICEVSLGRYGEETLNYMSWAIEHKISDEFGYKAETLLANGLRFVCEYQYRLDKKFRWYEEIIRNLNLRITDLNMVLKPVLSSLVYSYPLVLVMEDLKKEKLDSVIGLRAAIDLATNKFNELNNLIASSNEQIQAEKDSLAGIKHEFNFVKLNEGFKGLRDRKAVDEVAARKIMNYFGFAMLVIPILQIIFFLVAAPFFPNVYDGYVKNLIYIAPSLIATELIVLYFFRIQFMELRSIKAQILQLDLRVALCQFVRGYTDYSITVDENKRPSLDKFENVVFSGIAASEIGIPTTFDGLSEVAKLIESIKLKK